jgi:hypothetical protein
MMHERREIPDRENGTYPVTNLPFISTRLATLEIAANLNVPKRRDVAPHDSLRVHHKVF